MMRCVPKIHTRPYTRRAGITDIAHRRSVSASSLKPLVSAAQAHSVRPLQIAGQFAKRIGAKHLFLNHLSSRYIDAGSTLHPSGTGSVPVDISPDVAVTDLGIDRSGDYSAGTANSEFKRRLETVLKIEEQATEAWSAPNGVKAVATRDFMTIVLKRKKG